MKSNLFMGKTDTLYGGLGRNPLSKLADTHLNK
jgi:hypothetical protein